ncbi:MAG: GIY-YIG nuclease family protein [Salinibacter sp.]
MSNGGFVYILASTPNGTLYIGVTSDVVRRIQQHRRGEGSSFVNQYDVTREGGWGSSRITPSRVPPQTSKSSNSSGSRFRSPCFL